MILLASCNATTSYGLNLIGALMCSLENRNVQQFTNSELHAVEPVNDNLKLSFVHTELEKSFERVTDAVILATGYKNIIPSFLNPCMTILNGLLIKNLR